MNFNELPLWKLIQLSRRSYILKARPVPGFDHTKDLYIDNNITLKHLFTQNDRIAGYTLDFNGNPRLLVRQLSIFAFYSSVKDIGKVRKINSVYNDNIIRLFTTHGKISIRTYAFVLRWSQWQSADEENESNNENIQ